MILLGILGGTEILVVLGLVLILFGGKQIPELMRGLGKGIKEFKDATNIDEIIDETKNIKKDINKLSSPKKNLKKAIEDKPLAKEEYK